MGRRRPTRGHEDPLLIDPRGPRGRGVSGWRSRVRAVLRPGGRRDPSGPGTVATRMSTLRSKGERVPLPPGYMVVWSTVVIDLIGFGIALPVLGPYARDHFQASGTTVGLLMSCYSLAQFVCTPIQGRLSDRYGRKPILIAHLRTKKGLRWILI